MNIEKYYNLNNTKLSFSRESASEFAKSIAGDFNSLHDPDSKRFCVPGDLLFAVMIHHYGLSQVMEFSFSGMVSNEVTLYLPEVDANKISIYDEGNKKYLDISTEGGLSRDANLINSLTEKCVQFSGHTFPHVLVPLMKANNVMINTDRPLVIYDHMRISLDTLDLDSISLKRAESQLQVYGKRGDVSLNFELTCNGETVGVGQKKMVLSGLREFDQDKVDALIQLYEGRKKSYLTDLTV